MTLADRKGYRTVQLVRRGIVTGDLDGVHGTVRASRPGRDLRDDVYCVYHTHDGDKDRKAPRVVISSHGQRRGFVHEKKETQGIPSGPAHSQRRRVDMCV